MTVFVKDLDSIDEICLTPDKTVHEAIATIDRCRRGIVLIVDNDRHLQGTITDGDVRRAMLDGLGLDAPITRLLEGKTSSFYPEPVTATVGTAPGILLQLMQKQVVRQLPLLNEAEQVVDLVTVNDLLPEEALPVQAAVMAGGLGTRLRPLSKDVPKPMLPVGDRPLMELIIEQLREAGIKRVNVFTHYLPEKIREHFQDGEHFGVEMNYVDEDRPLGTAGGLGLLQTPHEPLLVINGDILTGMNFRALLAFHRECQADMTIAVRQYDLQVPYGIIECEGANVRRVREKPHINFFVNAGIYLLEPAVQRFIPDGQRIDMTDVIQILLDANRPVVSFPIHEYWLDIGQPDDYLQAQKDLEDGRLKS